MGKIGAAGMLFGSPETLELSMSLMFEPMFAAVQMSAEAAAERAGLIIDAEALPPE